MSFRNFIFLIAASFGAAWLFGVIVPFVKMRHLAPLPLVKAADGADGFFYPKRGGRTANGALVYAENGCYLCHTQVVRPTYAGNDMYRSDMGGLASDPDRGDTRRETNAYDYFGEKFAQIGTTRLGPDLSNVGRRYEAAAAKSPDGNAELAFYRHLYDPRMNPAQAREICPANKFMFKRIEFKGPRPTGAMPFGATDTSVLVPDSDARALVSYLMSLKKDQLTPASLQFPTAGKDKPNTAAK